MGRESGVRRRVVLTGIGTAIAGVVAAGACSSASRRSEATLPARPHQLGVLTHPPAAAAFAAFDFGAGPLEPVLRALTDGAATTAAEVTVAVGASLFDHRFGLAGLSPRRLTVMPAFPNDLLDPASCHGDLLLQVCADDRRTADAALRRITDLAGGALRVRWRIDGFRDENTTTARGRASTRDLFGFREGAGNPDVSDPALMDRLVWVPAGGDEPAWATGGSYQVIRLIRVASAIWDAEPVARQEAVFGRRKADGAPLGYDHEDAVIDYTADPTGRVIALDSHIRRANPRTAATEGSRILRRGYSYRRGTDSAGHADEGLIFVCFQRDIETGFAAVQRRLAGQALDKYVLPVGGGYFFLLPGRSADPDDYLGRSLLDAR